ncbi:MAG: cyanophycinase [Acidobacteria bacterium]|nr:cyanophycinase [Acidobacteriota bacterium]MBV9478819.1 cyanophycinase [Acidobacteriota bacterium]
MTTKRKTSYDRAERKIGRLLVIGGNEDKDEDSMTILPHFVKMCGGKRARILVCGTPSKEVEEKERTYRKLFEKIGVAEVMEPDVTRRYDGDNEELVEMVRRATGVFFTGGDQLRLTAIVAGTPFGNEIRHRVFNEGLVAGGTSAGAAAMSSTMIISGNSKGTVRRADVGLAPGLGYWRDTVVDTHFAQRGRVSRMLVIFAHNPQILGVGIDEDTAVEVHPGERFTVIGNGAVFVFDGTVTYSNAPDAGDDDVLAMTDSMMHVLPAGYSFDLRTKRPILPNGEIVPAKAS